MGDQMITEIDECLRVLRQLDQQLDENVESFNRSFSGALNATYSAQNQKARESCTRLRKLLLKLREEESAKLLLNS